MNIGGIPPGPPGPPGIPPGIPIGPPMGGRMPIIPIGGIPPYVVLCGVVWCCVVLCDVVWCDVLFVFVSCLCCVGLPSSGAYQACHPASHPVVICCAVLCMVLCGVVRCGVCGVTQSIRNKTCVRSVRTIINYCSLSECECSPPTIIMLMQ
jgi:hypothetical protein